MQTEVLYGARLSAAAKALVPLFIFIALLISSDGRLGGTTILVAVAALGYAMWEARGAWQPKVLQLDREGLVFQPAFSSKTTRIPWALVSGFEVKGSNKSRKLVCRYLDNGTGAVQSLNLGDGWSLDGTDMFANHLDKVRDYLETYRARLLVPTSLASASAVVHRPLVEVVAKTPSQHRPVPKPVQRPDLKPALKSVAAATQPPRSGQVYAEKATAQTRPVTPSLNGETKSLKGLGAVLLGVGAGVAALSVIPFMKACQHGLCGQGLWDMGDYRIWLFATLWTVCLLAVLAGGVIMAGARDDSR